MLWGGWGERKRKRAGSPARFLFFRLFYFDGDTQREPLRRRELASGEAARKDLTETGNRARKVSGTQGAFLATLPLTSLVPPV